MEQRLPLPPVAGGSGVLSNDPADVLIRELIRTGRVPTARETQVITDRMASAEFSPVVQAVPLWLQRSLNLRGIAIGTWADGLTLHHAKHVLLQEQWRHTVSVEEYFEDARTAIAFEGSWIAVLRHGGHRSLVGIVTQTADIVRVDRLGPSAGPWMLVVYSAATATIVTAYMVRHLARIRITGDVVWLR